MKWYPYLYVGERAASKKNKILRRLKIGAGLLDVWVITVAANGVDQFDILSSAYLKQRAVRKKLPMIVGIAKGYEEALEVVLRIVEETYQNTGTGDARSYLKNRCRQIFQEKMDGC